MRSQSKLPRYQSRSTLPRPTFCTVLRWAAALRRAHNEPRPQVGAPRPWERPPQLPNKIRSSEVGSYGSSSPSSIFCMSIFGVVYSIPTYLPLVCTHVLSERPHAETNQGTAFVSTTLGHRALVKLTHQRGKKLYAACGCSRTISNRFPCSKGHRFQQCLFPKSARELKPEPRTST